MEHESKNNLGRDPLKHRWFVLAVGVFAMLFAGIIYAWSILKIPLAEENGYSGSLLAFNFTLTMSFFCIGGLLSGYIVRRIGTKLTIMISGALSGLGFVLSSFLQSGGVGLLYLTYSFMSGLGIGMAYIVIISTVNSWFPDKRGTSSGALMMGFGASSLILGNLAATLFDSSVGWRNTYILIGISLAVVLVCSAFFIKMPDADVGLPVSAKKKSQRQEKFEARDYRPSEIIRRFTFWRAFIAFVCVTAVGNSVISCARDLAISVGAKATLATTLVGVLAVCNGLGRIITGAVFDKMGRRFTIIAANILTIVSALITLLSVKLGSVELCVVGLCLVGMSYGSSPTNASAFTSTFYGTKYFAANLGIVNFNLMGASFIATACASLRTSSGGFVAPFVLLLSLACGALVLNICVRKP